MISEERLAQIRETVRRPEVRAKISQNRRGIGWAAGQREKFALARKGKKLSPERLERLRATSRSPEVRAKMRAAKLGKKKSPEAVAKCRAGLVALYASGYKKKSPKSTIKIGEGRKRWWASLTPEQQADHQAKCHATRKANWEAGKFKLGWKLSADAVARRLQNCRPYHFTDTIPELELERQMKAVGTEYQKQYKAAGHVWDFFVAPNIVIDVDGCYWHGCQEHCASSPHTRKQERDAECNRLAIEAGFAPVRIWEHELVHVKTKKSLVKHTDPTP